MLGRPKVVRVIVKTTGLPFEISMGAVRSNVENGSSVTFVIERKSLAGSTLDDADLGEGTEVGSTKPLFDPMIFE